MSKILELEKQLKATKAVLEKAMYKPAAPYRKPTSTTAVKPKAPALSGTVKKPAPIGEKNDITVAHTGSHKTHHQFEVRKKGNVIGDASVRHDRDKHDEVDTENVGDWDESSEGSNGHTADKIIKEHISKNPEAYKQLKATKAVLEKAMYKPAAPYRKPTSTTTTPKQTEFKVVPLGKATHKNNDGSEWHEHGYEVYHNGKSVGTGSVQVQPDGKHTCDLAHNEDVDESTASKAIDHIEVAHKKIHPDHEFQKSLDERLDDVLKKINTNK